MFCGQYRIQIRDDGAIIPGLPPGCTLTEKILGFKGKPCTVCFDRYYPEVMFAFGDSLPSDPDITALFTFITGNDEEEISRQFYIPEEYMGYYPDGNAFLLGIGDAFRISAEGPDSPVYDGCSIADLFEQILEDSCSGQELPDQGRI